MLTIMPNTPQQRAAHAAYMREYMQRPEPKAKEKIRRRAYYQKNKERLDARQREYLQRPEVKARAQAKHQAYYQQNAEEFKVKQRAYVLARHEASPLIPCGCGCGEQIHSIGKSGKPVFYVLGHRHRLPVAHPTGEAHPNWKGSESLSGTVHDWLNRWYVKTGICEKCGNEGRTHFAFNHRLGEHTRNRDDYRELCPKCHNLWDIEMGVQRDVGTLRKKALP